MVDRTEIGQHFDPVGILKMRMAVRICLRKQENILYVRWKNIKTDFLSLSLELTETWT
jgi:hypothetical protein